jgi:hypothetical protein
MSSNSTAEVKFANPRLNLWNGVVPAPYLENTSTTAERHDPRFDYDPSTRQPRGLLIEGTSNNLLLTSDDYSGWANTNSAVVDETGATAPDGTSTPDRISDNSTNGEHFRSRQPNTTTTGTYTMSVWFKNPSTNGRRYAGLQLYAGGGTDTGGVAAVWDFNTGAATSTVGYGGKATPASVAAIQYPNGWWKATLSISVTGTLTTLFARILLSSDGTATSYANSGTALGILAWGAQLEAGSGASSYIPTGASQGSRAADICYITNADYGFTTTGGTYFVEWERGEFATVSGQACNPISTDYASGRWLGIGTAPAGTTATAGSWSGFLNATGAAVAGRNRAAVSYSSWVASASGVFRVNGGSEIAGTLTLGTTPTYLMIGSASASAPYNGIGLRDFVNSRIRRIKYWPSVLPSATLQAITVNT